MPALQVECFICLSDNYGVLVHDPASGQTASIDAPDADAILGHLKRLGWRLTHILVTHHHGDHVDGILPLKEKTGCRVVGSKADAARIPGLDEGVAPAGRFQFAGHDVLVLDCPGHTLGHIAYHLPDDKLLFAADTLFALGCGRVIEGSFEQMWRSLDQMRALPRETRVYFGHEYTEANARFALSVEPGNRRLQDRARAVAEQRKSGQLTCPTTIAEELETNPFLRPESAEIRKNLGLESASDADVFAETRRRKNDFK